MAIIERGGVRYGQTTIQIPLELKEKAKLQNLSFSKVLTTALKAELGEIET